MKGIFLMRCECTILRDAYLVQMVAEMALGLVAPMPLATTCLRTCELTIHRCTRCASLEKLGTSSRDGDASIASLPSTETRLWTEVLAPTHCVCERSAVSDAALDLNGEEKSATAERAGVVVEKRIPRCDLADACNSVRRGSRSCGEDRVQLCALVHTGCPRQDRFLAHTFTCTRAGRHAQKHTHKHACRHTHKRHGVFQNANLG